MKTDVVIVGCGVAGLYCALNIPENKNIIMITKSDLESSDSFLAQGGICVLQEEDDYESYFEDTCKAGHYENREESVDIMIRSSAEAIDDLVGFGVDFERRNGAFIYTKEGGHSRPRILYHKDITGKEITSKLLQTVLQRRNITLLEYTTMVDILVEEDSCKGIVARSQAGEVFFIQAAQTVFATGGIGGLFEHSTNFPHLTADAVAIASKHGIALEHMDYIQIHPTTLYSKKTGRRFLISESVRGEGAILLNAKGERFVNELLPRDLLSKAILEQMKKDRTPYVRLSMKEMDQEEIRNHFPNIIKRCEEEGIDVSKDYIPVVPAQHYFMGGIWVDLDSRTTMEHLYAIGETSCNGVHGANRLASNSLLESLVFAKRAAVHMLENWEEVSAIEVSFDADDYDDYEAIAQEYSAIVQNEIERAKQAHEQSNFNETKCRSAHYAGVARRYHE